MFALFQMIVSFVLSAITGGAMMSAIMTHTPPSGFAGLIFMLWSLFALASFVPSLAVAVRRLHDSGKSGAWILVALVPVIGGLVLLVLYLLDGTPGDNQYGPDPKGRASLATVAA
ncbi:DUF805 domain-containing protein [Phenylobacterium montanum]|nr:DUF805 domain-containing protein [Caulobacter sp. S6]